jgi:hypothetical protein
MRSILVIGASLPSQLIFANAKILVFEGDVVTKKKDLERELTSAG